MDTSVFETCWYRGNDGQTVVIRCQRDRDGRWRWYQGAARTSFSAETHAAALELAVNVWGTRQGFGAGWW